MADRSLRAFSDPVEHEAIAALIRRRSTNRADVHELLLRGLDLAFAREALDLGCGFGLFAGKAAPRLAAQARVTGVDVCAANERPFRKRVEAAGRRARFVAMRIESTLPWPDGAFDLILSSYSLYFFPEVLPEIARLLAPQGIALVLTHRADSDHGLARAAGIDPERSPLTALVRRFCAENAGEMLARHFGSVLRIDYPNELRFGREDLEDALAYLRFKLPQLGAGPGASEAAARWLAEHGEIVEGKDDAGFRCRGPRR